MATKKAAVKKPTAKKKAALKKNDPGMGFRTGKHNSKNGAGRTNARNKVTAVADGRQAWEDGIEIPLEPNE